MAHPLDPPVRVVPSHVPHDHRAERRRNLQKMEDLALTGRAP